MSLQGQVALVTGARGIGGASARVLAQRGAVVVATYKQNQQAAEQLVQTISAEGGAAQGRQLDVLDAEAVNRVVADIQRQYGRLDILVSNAAVGWVEKPFAELHWGELIGVVHDELQAAFNLTQAVLPIMQAQRSGCIIYMASKLATHTLPDTVASSTAKGALVALMRNIAAAYGPEGITANAIAPGLVLTDVNADMPQQAIEAIRAGTPLRRIASPEDVAGVVAFLAGPDGRFMTGSYLLLDGGVSLAA